MVTYYGYETHKSISRVYYLFSRRPGVLQMPFSQLLTKHKLKLLACVKLECSLQVYCSIAQFIIAFRTCFHSDIIHYITIIETLKGHLANYSRLLQVPLRVLQPWVLKVSDFAFLYSNKDSKGRNNIVYV